MPRNWIRDFVYIMCVLFAIVITFATLARTYLDPTSVAGVLVAANSADGSLIDTNNSFERFLVKRSTNLVQEEERPRQRNQHREHNHFKSANRNNGQQDHNDYKHRRQQKDRRARLASKRLGASIETNIFEYGDNDKESSRFEPIQETDNNDIIYNYINNNNYKNRLQRVPEQSPIVVSSSDISYVSASPFEATTTRSTETDKQHSYRHQHEARRVGSNNRHKARHLHHESMPQIATVQHHGPGKSHFMRALGHRHPHKTKLYSANRRDLESTQRFDKNEARFDDERLEQQTEESSSRSSDILSTTATTTQRNLMRTISNRISPWSSFYSSFNFRPKMNLGIENDFDDDVGDDEEDEEIDDDDDDNDDDLDLDLDENENEINIGEGNKYKVLEAKMREFDLIPKERKSSDSSRRRFSKKKEVATESSETRTSTISNRVVQCEPGHFGCSNGFECFEARYKCDGFAQCSDSSDELMCNLELGENITSLIATNTDGWQTAPTFAKDNRLMSAPDWFEPYPLPFNETTSSKSSAKERRDPDSNAKLNQIVDNEIIFAEASNYIGNQDNLADDKETGHESNFESKSIPMRDKPVADVGSDAPHYSKIISSQSSVHPFNSKRQWHDTHIRSIHIGREIHGDYEGAGGLNSAIIAIMFGIGVTGMLIVIVGHKMGSIRERMAYKSRRRSLVPDTDYLINTLPI